MDWSVLVIVIQLIFLEGILSLDNAAVLGALVSDLSDELAVVWPRGMRKFGAMLHPLLGNQRTAALRAGLLGAYLGRGVMLFLATIIISNPWLKLVGAAYLVHLAFDNLGTGGEEEEGGGSQNRWLSTERFWMVVLTVEMTDLVFSLDNVVAAVSLSNKFWVVMLGVAIGILMMRFAAGLFSYAVNREPILKKAAYILVLIIGVELLVEEIGRVDINQWLRFGISMSAILLCLLYAHSKLLQRLDPLFAWLARGFGRVNSLVDWVLEPLYAFFRLVGRGARWLSEHFQLAPVEEPGNNK